MGKAVGLATGIVGGTLAIGSWYDLRERRIPNLVIACGVLALVAIRWAALGGTVAWRELLGPLGLFTAGWLLPSTLVGMGDVKLAALLWYALGPTRLLGLMGLAASFMLTTWVVAGRSARAARLPMAPYVLAAWLVLAGFPWALSQGAHGPNRLALTGGATALRSDHAHRRASFAAASAQVAGQGLGW